jgi:hypothetical protein
MANNIVQVNVSQTIAPAPSTLQRTGAFLSVGGTTLDQGVSALITQESELTALLRPAAAISSATYGSLISYTCTAPHGIPIGNVVSITTAGFSPSGYNGTFDATATTSTVFTRVSTNPGAMTVAGTWIPAFVAELASMADTFFAQGSAASVYVLELGLSNAATAVAYLDTWISASTPQIYYAYLCPRQFTDNAAFLALMADFEATTAMTYFYTTATLANYTGLTVLMKCVVAMIESPDAPSSEFSLAAAFYALLNTNPSTTNKVAPFSFRYLFGVTAYPLLGNGALFATLKAARINWVGTGAEGGITNTVLMWGTTRDGRDISYWYSVDWVQINVALDLANEIINGSNNAINPLYYNQDGINRLQARSQATMNRGISYGLVLAPVTVAAVPFPTYVLNNPSDYPIGKYAGLSVSYTPARGFIEIIFNVNVTDFPAA